MTATSACGLLAVLLPAGLALSPTGASAAGAAWGDQGDGTFANPLLPGDYSDIDAIRVGDDYYAISSTLHLAPGMVVLHSRDLVHWEAVGHAIADVTRLGPSAPWRAQGRYGRGVWAGALRWHAGRFWVYFSDPDAGLFVTTAPTASGPWEPVQQLWAVAGWDDCCPFWDDDGQAYLVATHFADKYKIHLFALSDDGRTLRLETGRVIHQSAGSEANKLYKWHGRYYHYFSEVRRGVRVAMMARSNQVWGPYDEVRQLYQPTPGDGEPNQGGLVDTPAGEWWFVTHRGRGTWFGRDLCLLPVTWRDGWPLLGKLDGGPQGGMVWRAPVPQGGQPLPPRAVHELFDQPTLGPEWEWNHAPRDEMWSLTERPGWLRLRAFRPARPGGLLGAGNTLSQRSLGLGHSTVTVLLEVGAMADGQRAGLCHFSSAAAGLGVAQDAGQRRIARADCAAVGPVVAGAQVWLRSTWGPDGLCRFSYSFDGQAFSECGPSYQARFGHYRGDRCGLYSYNELGEAGWVDVRSWRYEGG